MNYYPGQGLTIGAAILGTTLGQEYAAKTLGDICKIHGVLLDAQDNAAGNYLPSFTAVSGFDWQGVQVTARLVGAVTVGTSVITTQSSSVETLESGYFEFNVLRGLSVVITSPVLDKPVVVDTTGHASLDISSYF
jgi:hypothetical protein